MHFGPWEIGLILVIILIVFGVGKLPQVGSAMGKAMRSFRSESKEGSAAAEEDPEPEVKAVPRKRTRKAAKVTAAKAKADTEKTAV